MNIDLITVNIILVCVTLIYVIFTGWIARSNYKSVKILEEQMDAYQSPYISITHRLKSNAVIELLIENVGRTSARNLKLDIDKDYFLLNKNNDAYNLKNMPSFKNVIGSFPPKSILSFPLLSGATLHGKQDDFPKTPFVFTITASYEYLNTTRSETTVIDLRPYINTSIYKESMENNMEDIIKVLKEIRDVIKQ